MEALADHFEQIVLTPQQLAARWSELERELAVFALAVAHVDDSGRWADDGSVTMRSWMREHLRMSDADAGTWIRRASLLNHFSAFAECAVSGALSSSQLREVEKCARPRYRDLLRELQEDLAADIADLDAAATAAACASWRQHADALVDGDEPAAEPERSLNTTVLDDGSAMGWFRLDPAGRVEFDNAINNAITWAGKDETRSVAERRGDALFDIVAFFNLNHSGDGTPRHHPHVSMSMDAANVNRPEARNDATGEHVDSTYAGTKLCDCLIHAIIRDAAGTPLAFGRATYTVPRALFKQIVARDGGCRFPGCDRPVRFTEAHHMHWWERHGPTNYDNLALMCSRHHHLIHQLDLQLEWVDGWDLQVTWPDGRERTSAPRGAPPRREPLRPAA